MKSLLFLILICSSIVQAQSEQYEEIVVSFSGDIEPSKSILTPSMKSKVLKHLKIIKPADYTVLATATSAPDKNMAVIRSAKTKVELAWVLYDGAENIIQTTWYEPMINATAIIKVKTTAYKNGLSKTDKAATFLKISNKTGTWYQVVGTVDGSFGFIFISEAFSFLSKHGEEY